MERKINKERLNLGERIILFIGPEGSGKTSIAKKIAEESDKPYITTGGIIRDFAANDSSQLGDECREMFANHIYLNGETLLKILIDRFSQDDTKDGFILDGGLSTIVETIDFKKMLKKANRDLPLTIIQLDIPEKISFDRLLDGKEARKRVDDTFEGIKSRLTKYYSGLSERVDVIKNQKNWTHFVIDASPPIDEVFSNVKLALK